MHNNTTGDHNTALGVGSLLLNTTGSYNTAIGRNALLNVTSGSQNTAIGLGAGSTNSQGTGNIFVGYMAGSQERGSNKLYIDNTSTPTPLIYGDFETDSLTFNGDVKVTGNLTADKIVSTSGEAVMHFEETTGAVHVGQNSMVFYDSEGPIGNGKDIMASSVGKIQIGNANTDITRFIGEVHVPEPTKPTHAVTKQYTDSTAAMTMAMASAVDANKEGNHMGFGYGDYAGQSAMAFGISLQFERTKLKIIASQSETMEEPAFSGGFSWSF